MKSYMCADKLTMTVIRQDDSGTYTCKVESQQPWLLLSRSQVRALLTVCRNIFTDFHQAEVKEKEEPTPYVDMDEAKRHLEEKIRFVTRGVGMQYPALLHVASSELFVSEAEMNALLMDIEMWADRLEEHDAIGYVAFATFDVSARRHLIVQLPRQEYQFDKPERRIPTLCGRMPQDEPEMAYSNTWFLTAVFAPNELTSSFLCHDCLEQWQRIFSTQPSPQRPL